MSVVCLEIWVALTLLLAKLGGGSIYLMALQQPSPQKNSGVLAAREDHSLV